MTKYYLAIDIGASGGRHILGHLEEGRLVTEEVYRFDNGMIKRDGELVWDIEGLFHEVLKGLKRCAEIGRTPYAIGIDTWGVDFVLLDGDGVRIGQAVAYRDERTEGMDEEVGKYVPFAQMYKRTGIQQQPFNTVYQLMALKTRNPEQLERAECMLMIPDYLGYLLTGRKAWEYTNATTTGLVNARTGQWDREIIDRLGIPGRLFGRISPPGTLLGGFSDEIKGMLGYDSVLYMTASHDTASAVAAVPGQSDEMLYISSGTWSLMGTELTAPVCGEEARNRNMTNEGGYGYRYRFLKNIMGLWMLQKVRKEICPEMNYDDIGNAAYHADIDSMVDVNDSVFLAPESMTEAISTYLVKAGEQVPDDIGGFARVIYRSLARCYRITLEEIENLTGAKYTVINIVGGGSQSDLLNRMTAEETGRTVLSGPVEGTAIGNLTVIMIACSEIKSLEDGRRIIAESVPMKRYEPGVNRHIDVEE